MHRLGWGIVGSAGIALAVGLAGGCASSNNDATGGAGGTGTTSSATSSTTGSKAATTGVTASATTGVTSSATTSTTTTSVATSTAMSSSSTGSGVPATWTCNPSYYAGGALDGCDCGCGALDPDCASALVAACDTCADNGSCSPGSCPGSIDPMDNTKCVANQPENTAALCADGVDNDFDTDIDCLDTDCQALAVCQAPMGWTCGNTAYFDTLCDCGCGVADPKCTDATSMSCDSCNDTGGCGAAFATCAVINDTNNTICKSPAPENTDAACSDNVDNDFDGNTDCDDTDCQGHLACAPVAWKCNPAYYGTADGCDCGCGAKDPDCADLLVATCDACADIGSCSSTTCPGTINPTNNVTCM